MRTIVGVCVLAVSLAASWGQAAADSSECRGGPGDRAFVDTTSGSEDVIVCPPGYSIHVGRDPDGTKSGSGQDVQGIHVYLDGNAGNQYPLGGYIGVVVHTNGNGAKVRCKDGGGWYTGPNDCNVNVNPNEPPQIPPEPPETP